MRHFVSARLARIPLLRPNALPRVTRRTLTSTSSTPASPRNIGLALGVTAIATASYLLGQANIVQAHAEQNQGPLVAAAQAAEQKRYASPEEVQKVIDLLRKGLKPDQVRLREDQVSTNPDDRLVHGSSPNTYHGEWLFHSCWRGSLTSDSLRLLNLVRKECVTNFSPGTARRRSIRRDDRRRLVRYEARQRPCYPRRAVLWGNLARRPHHLSIRRDLRRPVENESRPGSP